MKHFRTITFAISAELHFERVYFNFWHGFVYVDAFTLSYLSKGLEGSLNEKFNFCGKRGEIFETAPLTFDPAKN